MTDRPLEILSLGAGVQSTTVLMMSEAGELPPLDCAIFADTQWEPKAVYDHLDWLDSVTKTPIHRVTAGDLRADAIGRADDTSRAATIPYRRTPDGALARRQCTREYKIAPLEKFIRRELLGLKYRQRAKPGAVRSWVGISLDEIQRMPVSRNKWQSFWCPLIERRMSRSSCYEWMERNGYPEPPRSACIGCPFRTNKEWRDLTPDEFEDACEFDESIRVQDGTHGESYLHRKLEPLRIVDLRTDDEKSGQLSMWDDECCGVCNV